MNGENDEMDLIKEQRNQKNRLNEIIKESVN